MIARSTPAAAVVIVLVALLACSGCSRSRTLRCEVDFRQAATGSAAISCQTDSGPDGRLRIKEMVQDEALRVSEFSARASDGATLEVSAGPDSAMGSEARRFVERAIRGDGRIEYSYRVAPGGWTGDAMKGHHAQRFGWLDGKGGLLAGRNLFLLPSSYWSLSEVDLTFSLPEGWQAVGTLPVENGAVRLRGEGRAARQLVESVIGLGRFSGKAADVAAGRLRVLIRDDVPQAIGVAIDDAARRGFDFLGRRLGPLGAEYTVVLVPPPSDGSLLSIPPSLTGQGIEIAAAGPVEVNDLLNTMARAWTQFPGSPLTFAPGDAWLKDALPSYYGLLATGEVGARSSRDAWLMRSARARQEFTALGDIDPAEAARAAPGRAMKGSFLLAGIDARLRGDDDNGPGLDPVVERLLAKRGRQPLLELLAATSAADWTPVRDAIATSQALPLAWLSTVNRTEPLFLTLQPIPAQPARGVASRLRLLITGNTRGMLEVCGCAARQLGGIARRETLRRRLLGPGDPGVMIDLGNAYTMSRSEPRIDPAGRRELDLVLDLMGRQGYAGAAIGYAELLRGPGFFAETAARRPLPYVNANLSVDGRSLAPPAVVVQAGGSRVAIISVLDPPRYVEDHARYFEERLDGLQAGDPLAAVVEAARAARSRADLVFVIGAVAPDLARRILESPAAVDAILSTEGTAAALDGQLHFPTDDELTLIGFHGNRLLFFTTGDGRWLEQIDLVLGPAGHIASARLTQNILGEKVPDDPDFRRRIAAFYEVAREDPELAGSADPVARALPSALRADYVGAATCRPCHEQEYAAWDHTAHASAFSTLVGRHRNYAPRCIACHVTGYGYPSGYRFGDPLERLRHVQCEMCHGPGSAHAKAPSAWNTRRRPPREACFECHTETQSAMTEENFAAYYERVRHPAPSAALPSIAPPPASRLR